jgi:hypothetical protein
MAAGGIFGYALIAVSPTDKDGQPTGWLSSVASIILVAVVLVATLLLIGLRREVYQPTPDVQPITGNLGAMASIEEARRKRREARALAVKDPMMARELKIGRPDSEQGYDDGGLLDLNHATAEQLSVVCGIPHDVAEEVVASRTALGRFLTVEDAIVFGKIGDEHASIVRDRGIIIGER